MNSKFVVLLAFFVLLVSNLADAGGLSAERKAKRDTCGDLLTHRDSSSGSGEPCSACATDAVTGSTDATAVTELATTDLADPYRCNLTIYLETFIEFLSESEITLWIQWIENIKITIIGDALLTVDEKVVKIGYSMKAFFELNVSIKEKLMYKKIGSWGKCIDFMYVGVQIQLEITQEIVTLDASDNCALFDALRNFSAGDSEKEGAINELIINIKAILKMSSWSHAQKQAKIFLLFKAFFSAHGEWEAELKSIKVVGYGFLEYYLDVTAVYEKTTKIKSVVGGSVSECVLLKAIQSASQNTSYDISIRYQLQSLYQKLSKHFEMNVDVSLRLAYFSEQCFEYFELLVYLDVYVEQIGLESWGTIYDLLFCSSICTNYGCGDVNDGPGTEAPPATTKAAADCSDRWFLLEVDSSTNISIFITVLDQAKSKWSSSDRASFNTYYNLIVNAIYSSNTRDQIMETVVTNCNNFNKNNPAKQQQLLFSVYIEQWYGYIGQFVSCGTACNCN